MARRFRIHPSVGVARVGNSSNEFFIGPEHPGVPANFVNGAFASFRDESGRIKRQAARFRVFEYVDDGSGGVRPVEIVLGGDIADIEWRVHTANRKASFFTFNGQSGASDLYIERAAKALDAPETEDPPKTNRRNAGVPLEQRADLLDIDPGEQVVSRNTPGPVSLTNLNPHVPFIPDLGEIRIDERGRLLVLGGHGISGSTATPPVEIDEYANNDTWFDDVGDGPVKARIHMTDGTVTDADAAWVMVGPPDFAPTVHNSVTLYDLMWDLAVRELPAASTPMFRAADLPELAQQKAAWIANGGRSLHGYMPSFVREVYPILARALSVRDLHEPHEIDRGTYHFQLMNWELLASQDPADVRNPAALREYVFKKIRNPDAATINWSGMPRGLGDDYGSLDANPPKPTALFSLTKIQYALLEQWAQGNFISDWTGQEPGISEPAEVTPAGLDRAALETCVGGPFFPGIEVSWLVRRSELYVEPFRLDVPSVPLAEAGTPKPLGALSFAAGFFSQQMAQPWQADFYDCHKEEREGADQHLYYYMWWTAQRPDDTYAPGSEAQTPWVRHLISPGSDLSVDELETTNERFKQMVENWSKLPYILPSPSGRLEEEPR
jgi:hypothetical protein